MEKILALAVKEFKKLNRGFASWADWKKRAGDGAYELEIFTGESEPLFRASMMLKSKEVENALMLAMKYHAGQIRKGDGLEYIIHILQITRLSLAGICDTHRSIYRVICLKQLPT